MDVLYKAEQVAPGLDLVTAFSQYRSESDINNIIIYHYYYVSRLISSKKNCQNASESFSESLDFRFSGSLGGHMHCTIYTLRAWDHPWWDS